MPLPPNFLSSLEFRYKDGPYLISGNTAINYHYFAKNGGALGKKQYGEVAWRNMQRVFIYGAFTNGLIVFYDDIYIDGRAINYPRLASNCGVLGRKAFDLQWAIIERVWIEGINSMPIKDRMRLFEIDLQFNHAVYLRICDTAYGPIPWAHAIEFSEDGSNSMYKHLSDISYSSGLFFMHGASRKQEYSTDYHIGYRFVYGELATTILQSISAIVRLEIENRGGFRNMLKEHLPDVLLEIAIEYIDGKSLLRSVLGH